MAHNRTQPASTIRQPSQIHAASTERIHLLSSNKATTPHHDLREDPVSPTLQPFDGIEPPADVGAAEDESRYPTGPKLFITIGALLIMLAMIGLDISIVGVTIPAISDTFHTIEDIGWYAVTMRFSMASFLFIWGKSYSLFRVRNLLVIGHVLFISGNLMCTFARSSKMFVVGRAICGVGVAGIVAGSFNCFTKTFPLRKRGFWGGIGGAVESTFSVVAPLIGGALVDGWTWRACYGVTVPLALLAMGVVWFVLDVADPAEVELPTMEKLKRLDIAGTCIFAPGLIILMIGIQWGGSTYSWENPAVIATIVVGVLLMGGFFGLQVYLGDNASLPKRIMTQRSLLAGIAFSFCNMSVLVIVDYYINIYFQTVRGYSAAKAGVLLLPQIIGMTVACLISGGSTTLTGYYYPNMWVSTILNAVATGVLTRIDIDTKMPLVLALTAMVGFGFGYGIQSPQVAAQTVLKPDEATIGLALIQFGQQVGPVLTLSISSALFTNRLHEEVKTLAPELNISSLENMGLSELRNTFSGEQLKKVLFGYDDAIVQTLYLPLVLACLCIFGTVFMERRSTKDKDNQ